MKFLEALLERGRLILTIAMLLSLTGAVLWLTMVRQEDPRLPDFWGQVTVSFPGADALTTERLLLKPMEDALAQVDEVKTINSTAFDEFVVMSIELVGQTRDFDHAWDKVRDALVKARDDFPAGAGVPVLNRDLNDQDSVVLAVTGSPDLLKLRAAALRIKDRLLRLPSVSRVHLVADPGEQVTIEIDDPAAKRLGVTPALLARQLSSRNRIIPGGSIILGGKTVRLRPMSEFTTSEEIASTPIMLNSGSAVSLSEFASVHHGIREPAASRMRYNGEMAVGLAIVPKKKVNLVTFGKGVQSIVDSATRDIQPLKLQEVMFQPARTALRLSQLNRSLACAMLIVAGILFLAMGLRMGLVVTAVVPLVTLASLTLFAWGGGVLHQISIAAFVLALGMLVDNAIVIAENVQYRLDRGESNAQAAIGAVRELAVPLAGATATTLAAFVPMLISQGPTAAFTRTIPIIIMLCLSVSYVFAMLVTPVLSRMTLKPSGNTNDSWLVRFGYRMTDFTLTHSRLTMITALALVACSLLFSGRVQRQFFPSADRNQFVINLKLAEGSHLSSTDKASRILEDALIGHDKVVRVASFMGRSSPKFYYNINSVPFSPHFAQIVVETESADDVDGVLAFVKSVAEKKLPGIEVIGRKLEQGPPVQAPVEVRLFGSSFAELQKSALEVSEKMASVAGTRDIHHDMSPGAPTIRFHIDDAAAARYGINRADLSRTLYGRTRGLAVGELYLGDDPVPVLVRSSSGERLSPSSLTSVEVEAAGGDTIPLSQLAREEIDWTSSAIKHRNGRRVVTISSQLNDGVVFSEVYDKLRPLLRHLKFPPGITVAFGGEEEGAGEANTALMTSLPIGILMLFGVLLAEFNSFRRVALVLVTVPLAAAGIVPGLLLNHQPFGFMSLLGVFALVGIVVNNAIVLLEVIEEERRQGADVNTAVREAVARRIRPILLTTATTVAGLLPLAISSSTLWPPLASAMISGLISSTVLTLVIFPALYRMVFGSERWVKGLFSIERLKIFG